MILTQSRVALLPPITLLAVVVALLAPFLIYLDTARSIAAIWNSSDTFAHGYIILPVSLWLIWKKREQLAARAPTPFWPALALLAVCGFVWLLARLSDVQVVMQYAFAAMIPVTVLAVFGRRIAASIAFPLAFILLAVPFGEIFIDPLIELTADFTVAALQLTGIPVFRTGTNFEIPTGSWSVVEACSGVRYLISSVTLGTLYAYLTYQSTKRRVVFIIFSAVVPIVANCFRAYMIVMIGHLSDMQLATGVDHLVYGWLFFGLVMFVMFWVGSYWREEPSDTVPAPMPARIPVGKRVDRRLLLLGATGAIACVGIWPLYADYLDRSQENPATPQLSAFTPDWQQTGEFAEWKPQFFPARAELQNTYERQSKKVGVSILYYRNQQPGALLISSSNQLVSEKDPLWRRAGSTVRAEAMGGRDIALRESRLEGPSGSLLVWHWKWVGGRFIANDYLGKLLQTREKLLMQGDDGAAIFVSAPYSDNIEEARSTLRAFLSTNLPALEQALLQNKQPKAEM